MMTFSGNSSAISESHVLYKLHYTTEDGQLNIKWNSIPESQAYLLTVFEDDNLQSSNWIYSTEYSLDLSLYHGKSIKLNVAAAGKPPSEDVVYFNFTKQKPEALNPFGQIDQRSTYFSWTPVKDTNSYFFQLFDEKGEVFKNKYVDGKLTYTRIDEIPVGSYKWRVVPINKDKMKGLYSNWAYFSVTDKQLKVENIFGIEKHISSAPASTSLLYPEASVIGPDKAIYISDTHSNVIRRCEQELCEIFAGTLVAGNNGDGERLETMLNLPGGMVFDKDGSLVFLDIGNHSLRKVDKSGEISTIFTYSGSSKHVYPDNNGGYVLTITSEDQIGSIINIDNKGNVKRLLHKFDFQSPTSFYQNGNKILVSDISLQKLFLFENGELIRSLDLPTRLAGEILVDGDNIYLSMHTSIQRLNFMFEVEDFSSGFANVTYIQQGTKGNLLVTDSDNGTVNFVDKITGELSPAVGSNNIYGGIIKMEKYKDSLYLLDNHAASVFKYDLSTGVTTRFAGNGVQQLATIGGDRLDTGFYYPTGLTLDKKGNMYIAEQHHILKIDAKSGEVSLFAGAAGRGTYGFSGDGDKAINATFQGIRGISFDRNRNILYVADTYNNRIRQIDVSSGIVSTVAGNGIQGAPEYGVKAIKTYLMRPHDVTVSGDVIYISDSWNNTVSILEHDGTLQPFAGKPKYTGYQGNGLYSGDFGDATKSSLNTPLNAFDNNGIVYIADTFNNRIRVVKEGQISTLIGDGSKGFDPNNETILNFPAAVYADDNYVYVADEGNYLVRKYNLKYLLPNR